MNFRPATAKKVNYKGLKLAEWLMGTVFIAGGNAIKLFLFLN